MRKQKESLDDISFLENGVVATGDLPATCLPGYLLRFRKPPMTQRTQKG
jgi:hypothetical protein